MENQIKELTLKQKIKILRSVRYKLKRGNAIQYMCILIGDHKIVNKKYNTYIASTDTRILIPEFIRPVNTLKDSICWWANNNKGREKRIQYLNDLINKLEQKL